MYLTDFHLSDILLNFFGDTNPFSPVKQSVNAEHLESVKMMADLTD